MIENHTDRQSMKETVKPVVVAFLNQIEPQDIYAQQSPLGGIGYIRYDLFELWKVYEISEVFGIPSVSWLREIGRRQKENVGYALEVGDPVTAVEVREEYIRILLKQDKVEEAVQCALSITDGIDTSEPKELKPSDYEPASAEALAALIQWSGKCLGAWQLNQKREWVIRDIAIYLIEQGKIKKAEDLLRSTDTEMHSFGVFDALLRHHIEKDDIQAVHELMGSINTRLGELEPESMDYRSSRNECLKFIAKRAIETNDREIAIEYAEEIDVPTDKIAWYEEYVDYLVKQGETNEARQAIDRILDILDEETEWKEMDFEFDESVGRLDWTSRGRERKHFNLYYRATELIELAEQLTDYGGFDDVIDRLVDGSEEDGKDGARYAIDHLAVNDQLYFHEKLIELFTARGDWKMIDQEYHGALRKHPESQDLLNAKLAEILINEDPEQAKEIILSLTNPKIKRQNLLDFYLKCFKRGILDISQWKDYVREIEKIEDTILSQEECGFDTIELVNEGGGGGGDNIPEDNDPSLATVVHFGSSAFLLPRYLESQDVAI